MQGVIIMSDCVIINHTHEQSETENRACLKPRFGKYDMISVQMCFLLPVPHPWYYMTLLANWVTLAPPGPAGAINRAPTHWPSLRSAFFGNSPTESCIGRFFRKGASKVGCVILSAAKDLSLGRAQILRCAQDDRLLRPARSKKTSLWKSAISLIRPSCVVR